MIFKAINIYRMTNNAEPSLNFLDGGNRSVAETLANWGFDEQMFLLSNIQARQQ